MRPTRLHDAAAAGLTLALTVAALAAAAAAADPPRGLVLHYSFDAAAADGRVPDRTGKGHDGRASGVTWSPTGKQGGGALFAAGAGTIEASCPPAAGADDKARNRGVTVALWFRSAKAEPGWRRLLAGRAGAGCALATGGGAAGQATRGKLVFTAGDGPPCVSEVVVADAEWHHAAVTSDGETLRLYVDGRPQSPSTASRVDVAAALADLAVGQVPPGASAASKLPAFEGTVDDLMVFARALTADEIKAMVLAVDPAAGKPKFTKQQVAGRLRQLRQLYEEGLITEDFYARKVAECEAAR